MRYGNEENVKQRTACLERYTYKELLSELEKYISIRNDLSERMRNCNSDYAYWGLVADIEEFEEIIAFIEMKLINYLLELDTPFLKEMQDHATRYMKVRVEAEQIISDLEKYKPSQYKQKIELIKTILD
jgi:hypothetical protein